MFLRDNLAFSSPPPTGSDCGNNDLLVPAVARAPFHLNDDAGNGDNRTVVLNIELFGKGWTTDEMVEHKISSLPVSAEQYRNVLLFVPGVCESAETWTVQHLVRSCLQQDWQLAVLELPGHGLSNGPRALLTQSMDQLVDMVVSFARRVVQLIVETTSTASQVRINLVLAGASLGGALAAYAGPKIAQAIHVPPINTSSPQVNNVSPSQFVPCTNDLTSLKFLGCILLSPAVGVAQHAVPSLLIVSALSCLAYVAPGAAFLTPTEDPSHYNCPSWTTRNYQGQWPLGTSKLLLDITSKTVPTDIERCLSATDHDHHPFCCHDDTFECIVIAGVKDPIVPIESVRKFVEAVNTANSTRQGTVATLIELPKGDHGLLAMPKGKTVETTLDHIQECLAKLATKGN